MFRWATIDEPQITFPWEARNWKATITPRCRSKLLSREIFSKNGTFIIAIDLGDAKTILKAKKAIRIGRFTVVLRSKTVRRDLENPYFKNLTIYFQESSLNQPNSLNYTRLESILFFYLFNSIVVVCSWNAVRYLKGVCFTWFCLFFTRFRVAIIFRLSKPPNGRLVTCLLNSRMTSEVPRH